MQKPDSSGQTECKVKGQEEETSQSDQAEHNQEVNRTAHQETQPDETPAGQCSAGGLIETRPGLQCPPAEGEPKKRRPAATDHALQLSQLREHHQKALLRRDFQLQSVGLQARLQHRLWRQERTLLVQESQHLKQSLLLTSVKLRCFLQHWRLGHKLAADGRDILEVLGHVICLPLRVNSLKELYLLLEEEKQLTSPAHFQAAAEEQPRSPTIKWGGVGSTLADLRGALQGLSGELRLERQGSQELTQQFARAKASWEVERNELKSLITQVRENGLLASFTSQLENKTGKAPNNLSSTEALDPPDLKVALKREREEHQHLLAESYAAVMDLTKQLQIGERNWSREKMELVETLGQERAQWEQRGGEELKLQAKSKAGSGYDGEGTVDSAPNGSSPVRAKSMSELQNPEINGLASQEERSLFTAPALFLIRSELGDITGKNWSYLTNETPEVADSSKTWDGPTGPESELDPESVQKSFTAPDRTGIRIYYSPPAARRMAHLAQHRAGSKPPQQPHNGSLESTGLGLLEPLDLVQPYSSSYEQWLSSLSTPHQDPLESRGASSSAVSTNGAMADGAMDSSSSSSGSSASSSSSSSFRGLEMGDISVNLSDDMKEMTNCVRQAIRSSSLERKSTKEPGSQMAGMATRSTQTATQCTSVGLQTESVSVGRGAGLHSKAWSPRHSSAATSSLASARSRQISTSLDKVHSRIDRPCCSPKYGSPKLQRRVSTGTEGAKHTM
ncbi:Protein SOGA1 [Merluccius polli]|uniref:Protein SOGA1 n=1 Tax=Merluccius polli TaxID=89951 RepID=A0AA47N7Y8_MERPO|nr:Protein SOGA1 [Merluccius polli]